MSLRNLSTTSTERYSKQIDRLRDEIKNADAILVGAGAGMSASAGFTYDGERFEKNFADFRKKYGFHDMYSGGFYPYPSLEEYWAWWSKHIYINRYDIEAGEPYIDLLGLIKDKNYFVLTTNVDHQFQLAGFDKKRLFYTQGDYGLWQCSKACHDKTYDNEDTVRKMVAEQKELKVPSRLIPKCPVCGAPMTMNLRCDSFFVQDRGWYAAANRYEDFIRRYQDMRILFLELGVGANTPGIIKYPFWQMTMQNSQATYACINTGEGVCPKEIEKQSICINADISDVLADLRQENSLAALV